MNPAHIRTPTGSSVELASACKRWPALRIGLSPKWIAPHLTDALRVHYPHILSVEIIKLAILQYRPERCVVRYDLALHQDTIQPTLMLKLIGKFSQSNDGEQIHELMTQLWRKAFHPTEADRISIPTPLGYLPTLKMVLQEEVPGHQLNTLIKAEPRIEYAQLIGRTLSKLHRSELRPGIARDMQRHLSRCYPSHQALAQACPELNDAIALIVGVASELDRQISDSHFTTIHGDFHMKQIHVDGDRAWLLDFDALGWGDPASDLGNVILTLKHKADRLSNVPALISATLDEYFTTSKDQRITQRIHVYEAVNGLRRACKQLRLRQEGWRQNAGTMVTTAVLALEQPYE